MEKEKINQRILKNCYQNAQMAVISLNDVIPKCSGELKEELICERDGYEGLLAELSLLLQNKGWDIPDVNAMQKTMLSASIGLKTMADDSNSHIAEMVLKGSITGLTALIKDLSEFGNQLEDDVYKIVEKVKNFEEKCEEQLKRYL